MKKLTSKAIAITLAVLMIIGLTAPAVAASHPFNDVPDGAWFAEAVGFVYEHNIMGGVGNNRFDPQGNLTRAAVAALLFRVHNGRAANVEDDRDNDFADVADTAWYAPYVTWAFDNSIVTGTSATTFNPHGNITRQEFATMVYRYAMNMTDLEDNNAAAAQWSQFTDRGQIATWAYSALRWMNLHGIVTGLTATIINPVGTATRAEAAVMMMRFVEENERLNEDFVLTISVEETTLPQGENFRVHVELKNNSGEDHEIVHVFLFWPHIPNWHLLEEWGGIVIDPPAPQSRFFPANGILRNINLDGHESEAWLIGFTLEPGTHELRFAATFNLRLQDDFQPIQVWSNPITLTVQ